MTRVIYLDGEPIRDPVGVLEAVLRQCEAWTADGTPSLYIGGRTYAAEVILELVADLSGGQVRSGRDDVGSDRPDDGPGAGSEDLRLADAGLEEARGGQRGLSSQLQLGTGGQSPLMEAVSVIRARSEAALTVVD